MISNRVLLAAVCFQSVFALIEQSLLAQTSTSTLDTLTRKAASQLSLGNIEAAKNLYESALDIDKRSLAALSGLGKVAIAEHDWNRGEELFEKVVRLDTGNIAAHYSLGICYREAGTFKAWLLRDASWNTSRDHFQWVMNRDSLYEDVLYQYAVLLQYREQYTQAIEFGHTQIRLRPELERSRLGLFSLYRHYIADENPAKAVDWLKQHQNSHATYFVGETLRRNNKLAGAEEVFLWLLNRKRDIPVQPICLSLARIYFKQEKQALAEEYYWRAVNEISSWLGAALLFEDIKHIISDSELGIFNSLRSDRKKAAFFHTFWSARNPLPASRTNVRLVEHYRRLLYAEENFEYFGFRTYFNNPDKLHQLQFPKSYGLNQEFNDKGLIYLRHGEPDDIKRVAGIGRWAAGDIDPNESWMYNQTNAGPERVFYFLKTNASGNNWRLAPVPTDPRLMEDLVTWDVKYADFLRGNEFDHIRVLHDIADESRASVNMALDTDNHTWKKDIRTFEVPFAIDAFRSEKGKTYVALSYAIPLSPLISELKDSVPVVRSEVGISIINTNQQPILKQLDTISLDISQNPSGSFVDLYGCVVPPDSYCVSLHVRPLGTHLLAGWRTNVRIPTYATADLSVSDVQLLLPSNVKNAVEIQGIYVIPSPFRAYPRDRPLYVYVQIYNLVKDADGKTAIAIEYTLAPANSSGNEAIVVGRKERLGDDEFSAEFTALDVSKIAAGEYTLSVVVTDRKRVKTLARSRPIELYAP